MKKILNQLFEHEKLSKTQAKDVLINISKNAYNEAQVAAFISVYLMRGISVEELEGFREALIDLCIRVDTQGMDTIDLCGTGGDGKNTFNISTLSSFVVAGAGYKVTKHGNYGVSSVCGSSNVLEYLGYTFTNKPDELLKQLDKANICFLHAPLFHPALASVGPIRRQLGVKTFFNMLGPLVNPALPNHQSVGVFNLKLARLYQYLHEGLDKKYSIIHALDGYDEISLTGKTKIISNKEEYIANPGYFGLPTYRPSDIFGGDTIESAAGIFMNVLNNECSQAQKDVVTANSAIAIQCFDQNKDIESCVQEAVESIESGRAKEALNKIKVKY
ncbi:MAG: anthranilate phosphoribosyltransferase [Saprospiraceae bacterium]|nr:anthranilate phosphoribosyltransferase [Saprospiraceae bacterium]